MDELVTNSTLNEKDTRSATATTPGNLKRKCSLEPSSDGEDSQHREKRRREGDTPEDGAAIAMDKYTVGWVCALPIEMAAARGMLDRIHPNLAEQNSADHNSYVLGQIQGHNVVIACLPAGIYGTTPAATVAKDLLRTFKSIRFGVLVGIGGGAPSTRDIRLGDIVVSQPNGTSGGVIQYDRGKTVQEGRFQRTGSLNAPPQVLLSALGRLQADHLVADSRIPQFLSELIMKSPKRMKKKFDYQGRSNDNLFQAEYDHIHLASTCDQCDCTRTIVREPREDTDPTIHYGTIASGNQVIKDGKTRDRLSKDLGGVLCFEMEAAGLQDFPCLVIRGICDYADSHKNKMWQEYAAATAAAFAKELLSVVAPGQVLKEKPVPQLVSDPHLHELVSRTNKAVSDQTQKRDVRYENHRRAECHRTFKTSTYEAFKNLNPDRIPGTCKWVLEHPRYKKWQKSRHDDLLWISADPGCGKSVLAKSLIDGELQDSDKNIVLYFFFKDNDHQNDLATALCALLHQLFYFQPLLLDHALNSFEKDGEKLQQELDELWRIFIAAATDDQAMNVTCVLDALDECCVRDRRKLVQLLTSFHIQQPTSIRTSQLKFLVTSRPYQDIETEFGDIPESQSIRLAGEHCNADISEEINLVIEAKVAAIGHKFHLDQQTQDTLQEKLLAVPHRTYLWLYLILDEICVSDKRTKKAFIKQIGSLPTTVEDAYEKILGRLKGARRGVARTLLHIVVGARRPLTLSEMDVAFQIATDSSNAESHKEIDLDYGNLSTRIRELCGLFVFVNDNQIYLIHQTAKEFLVSKDTLAPVHDGQWKHSLKIQHSNTILTHICVQYLYFRDLKDIHISESSSIGEEDIDFSAFPLFEYSAVHWPAHLRDSRSDDEELLERVFGLYNPNDGPFRVWVGIFWEYHNGTTAGPSICSVHAAAFNGHDKVLARLLDFEKGAAINIQDGGGATPLMWGCMGGHHNTVELLLDKGADINAVCVELGSALEIASHQGHEKVVQALLDKGADVHAASGSEWDTALQAASFADHENLKIIQMLLDKGADVNAHGEGYEFLLHREAIRWDEKRMKMFLDYGADVDARDDDRNTALQLASSQGNTRMVQLLLDKGADVNAKGGEFGTALNIASYQGWEDIVQMLLDKGADANAEEDGFGNALHAAQCGGHKKIIQMLLAASGRRPDGVANMPGSHSAHSPIPPNFPIQLLTFLNSLSNPNYFSQG